MKAKIYVWCLSINYHFTITYIMFCFMKYKCVYGLLSQIWLKEGLTIINIIFT